MPDQKPDHGGDLDAARAIWGGSRADWLDLSTGINPRPYPLTAIPPEAWTALPDEDATDRLIQAARRFWRLSPRLSVLPAHGASALIAVLPTLAAPGEVAIPSPSYNEHAKAFAAQGWQVRQTQGPDTRARVIVHPNNPDGALFGGADLSGLELVVIDESFADVETDLTLVSLAHRPGVVVLKSFGKFWGLAGARLGFAIGLPQTLKPLDALLGPWSVSGPALHLGAQALEDHAWAKATRSRLVQDAARLDDLMISGGKARLAGGTPLFRLYDTTAAEPAQRSLAQHRIWTRRFPYSDRWLRLGLPGTDDQWDRLARAVKDLP